MRPDQHKHVHMLGIGGIGMSAIARYLRLKGVVVTGYDRTPTPLTDELRSEGIAIQFNSDSSLLGDATLVIYTPALAANDPEMIAAKNSGVTMVKRSEALGQITAGHKTIAVAGTHGKTSTTGLIAHLLKSSGVNCTAFVGGIMKNYNSNFLFGESGWMVVEADEFDRSFLRLNPFYSVITSMDADHLDIYGSGDTLVQAFGEFAAKANSNGTVFYASKLEPFTKKWEVTTSSYGLNSGQCFAKNIRHSGLSTTFDYVSPECSISDLVIHLPGSYNVENATAAISVALKTGASEDGIRKGLESFQGIKRRFDIRFRDDKVTYIDDYAHHPEEIRALLTAVKETLPERKMIAAFQPHLFSRTNDFYPGFAESLSMADAVILLDIYPARELPKEGVTSDLIFSRLTSAEKSACSLNGLAKEFRKYKSFPSVVLTIGAGDIDTQVDNVQKEVEAWI